MRMSQTFVAISLASITVLGACGGGGSDFTIAEEPLSGTVGGQSWTFIAGDTDAFLSEGEDDFFAVLYPTAFEPCAFAAPSGDHLILSIPKETGEWDLSLQLNMTFSVGDSDNLVGTDGVIRVDEVTATTVRGGIHAAYDDENEVDGTFEIAVCPDDPV